MGRNFGSILVWLTWTSLLLFAIFRGTGGDDNDDAQLSNIKKLKDKLFEKYDSSVRPVIHHSNTTEVQIGLVPLYLINLNEDISLFIMDSWLTLHWNDDRLSWNPEDYEGLSIIDLPDHKIWQPDVVVYNSHSWNMDPKMNTHLLLYSNGDVWWFPPAVFTTYCSTDPLPGTSYPRDEVECDIVMGSWTHDGWQINLTLGQFSENEGLHMDELMNTNPRWEILTEQVTLVRDVKHYNCCEEPYITVVAKFPLKRRTPPELQVIWAPCVLVMTLTLTMFWIPSDSGKKIVLGSFLFLSLIWLTVYVATVTKSPRGPPLAVSFLQSTMYAVVSALVLEIIVINLSNLEGPCRPPEALVRLLSGSMGKNIAVWARWLDKVPGDRIQLKEDTDQVVSHPTPKEEWVLVATFFERVLFAVYIIVFAAIHQA